MSMKMSNAETSSTITYIGQHKFPMTVQEAVKCFGNYLTEYERKEIQEY